MPVGSLPALYEVMQVASCQEGAVSADRKSKYHVEEELREVALVHWGNDAKCGETDYEQDAENDPVFRRWPEPLPRSGIFCMT